MVRVKIEGDNEQAAPRDESSYPVCLNKLFQTNKTISLF